MTAPHQIPTTESPRDVVGYAGGGLSASPATKFAAMADSAPGASRLFRALCKLAGASAPALFLAGAAWAQDVHHWGGMSHIRLQPSADLSAIAEVEFLNEAVHSDDDLTFDLSLGGLTVTVDAVVGRGETPDIFTVTPPVGYIADPVTMHVPEGETGVIYIRLLLDVGM